MKTIKVGYILKPIYVIQVKKLENDQDWEFVWVDVGNKKQMAVF